MVIDLYSLINGGKINFVIGWKINNEIDSLKLGMLG